MLGRYIVTEVGQILELGQPENASHVKAKIALLGSRIVELVLARTSEALLHSWIHPQTLHACRQLRRHLPLFRVRRQCEELSRIFL